MVSEEIKKMLIIAYSHGKEHGHRETVDGFFWGDGNPATHDSESKEWVEEALIEGVFERDLDL